MGNVMGNAARVARGEATYADLAAVPEHFRAELVGGELYAHPRPAAIHARAATKLAGKLDGAFDRDPSDPLGWIILFEPELRLRENVVVPDVAGWRRERMPVLPDAAFFTLAPDWVCEVLSPANSSLNRTKKMNLYAREGVAHVWLIDPVAEVLEVYRLEGDLYMRVLAAAAGEVVRAEPFAGYELPLAHLWMRWVWGRVMKGCCGGGCACAGVRTLAEERRAG